MPADSAALEFADGLGAELASTAKREDDVVVIVRLVLEDAGQCPWDVLGARTVERAAAAPARCALVVGDVAEVLAEGVCSELSNVSYVRLVNECLSGHSTEGGEEELKEERRRNNNPPKTGHVVQTGHAPHAHFHSRREVQVQSGIGEGSCARASRARDRSAPYADGHGMDTN